VAIVAHDLYLAQDLLTRRIANMVEGATGIPADHGGAGTRRRPGLSAISRRESS
jgi:hypothetical protein